MMMEKCFGINMKIIAISISKKNIPLLYEAFNLCKEKHVKDLIILLHGAINGTNSIVQKEGLKELIDVLLEQSHLNIHLVREGLGYDLSIKDYNALFENTSYHIEPFYTCTFNHMTLTFQSNNHEDFFWNDEHFCELQKKAMSNSDVVVSSVYKDEEDYWGKAAWKLSEQINSKLLYLDDGELILFEGVNVYKSIKHKLIKIKEYL